MTTLLSGKAVPSRTEETVREANENDIAALIGLASVCLGGDRQKLLKSLLTIKSNACYLAFQDGEVMGFVLAKVYEEMAEIGPLLCRRYRADVAMALLKNTLQRLSNLEVYACVPVKEKILLETLKAAGLEEKFRVTRMFLGSVPAESCVYVAESLERG